MKLHVSGFKLPRLGSIKDRVLRSYLLKEADIETRRLKFEMLQLMMAPGIDPEKKRQWSELVGDTWKEYLGALYNIEIPDRTEKEQEMLDFYEKVVKHLKPEMYQDEKTGAIRVRGLEGLAKLG